MKMNASGMNEIVGSKRNQNAECQQMLKNVIE